MPAKKAAKPAPAAKPKPVAKKSSAKAAPVTKGGKAAKQQPGKVAKPAPVVNPLFEPRPRNFRLGQDIPPKRDLTRFVKWPKYVVRQRRKRVLQKRLKVPPGVNQFWQTLDKQTTYSIFKLAKKYQPEDRKTRAARVKKVAQAREKDPKATGPQKKNEIKCGLQRVTRLVEQKRASLVLIAHDTDPLELVIWLPSLCKKNDVPYAIVKGKAALGRLCGFKTASCVAFMKVQSADQQALASLVSAVNTKFSERSDEIKRTWGGLRLGSRTKAMMAKKKEKMEA